MRKAAPETETMLEPTTLPEIHYISREESVRLFDELAQEYLGMSGEEFIRRYRAGEIEDPDRSDVVMLAIMIPFAEP